MTRHSKDVHGMEEKGHKCPKCFKSFPTSQQLAQHSLVHTNIRKFHCQYCDKTFKQLSHAFAQLANLQQHLKNHDVRSSASDKKPYSCSTCDRRFATEASLNHHVTKVHVLKPRMALVSSSNRVTPNAQPLAPVSTGSVVSGCGYIHNALSSPPVPFSYPGFDLCVLGALAASNVIQAAAGPNLGKAEENGAQLVDGIKQEILDPALGESAGGASPDHRDRDDDEERENVPECSPVRSPDPEQSSHIYHARQPPEERQPSREVDVLRATRHPIPDQSMLRSGGRLVELSKKDLNLLKLSSDKLYSFPTQVPPLNPVLYMEKPMTP
ncbi:hypothetical protein LSH36_172g00042 [Paralvinella palmiformis]|uniref:C2H2-type domain-containing protein n=1 Tax=Paralvinella palmiformis TaxID=53620 RepID=A0AAD9JSU3_9ANNE|nr:hypothetical protein LSH36_172g00042 [Paralvinella palmiformis]